MLNYSFFSFKSFSYNVKLLLFPIAVFGYGIISSFASEFDTRFITVPYRIIVISLSILILISEIYYGNRQKNLTSNNLTLLSIIMLFLFIICYSTRIIYDFGYNPDLVKDRNEYLLFWFFVCLIPALNFLFLESKDSKKYLYLCLLFLVIASVTVIPQILQNSFSKVFIAQGRLSTDALNPISLGHQSASLIIIIVYNFIFAKKNDIVKLKNINRFVNILLLIIGIILVIFSASRGPLIALIIVITLQFLVSIRQGLTYKKLSQITSIIIFISCLIGFSLPLAVNSGSRIVERISDSFISGSDFDTRFVQRPELYSKAIELISEYPIFGSGLEVPKLGYPHNLILEAFLSTGILGGSLFLILYICAITKAISIIMAKNNNWSWLGFIYIQYAIGAMFSGSLYGSYTFWYLLFAILGLRK
jgi:O-antigen ligase